MIAPTLFDAPYQAHSATSRAAAASMRGKTQTVRDRVLALLRTPMTDEELIGASAMNQNTVRPRRVELMKAGLIEQVGTRATRSGRQAAVWAAKEQR